MMRASAASSPDAHGGHGKQAGGLQAPSNGKRPSVPLSVFRECAVDGSTQLALDLQRPRAASGLSQFPVSNAQSPGPNSAFCLSLDRHPSHDLHPFVVWTLLIRHLQVQGLAPLTALRSGTAISSLHPSDHCASSQSSWNASLEYGSACCPARSHTIPSCDY